LTEREIAPSATSAAIRGNDSPHIAINPSPDVPVRGRLLVMLPGTAAVPRTYQLIVRTGAPLGFHVIGLTYPNDDAIEGLCGQSTDPDCAEDARREVILGQPLSPLVSVNPANSITGRLVALLQFLNRNFPTEGWGQYLLGNEPRWSMIRFAGHSQGAGHSAFIAKLENVDRTVMFSGPGDTGVAANSSANWLSLPNITPPERQFGFTHERDPLAPLGTVLRNWQTLGLGALGPVVNVDSAAPPFGNSRRLQTNAAPNPNPTGPSASPFHGAPVVDAVTPLDNNGIPLFRDIWIYLAYS
jgi:hypothetical protein